MTPLRKANPSMSRTNSSPGNFDGSMDRPMRLAEIHVAAEHALQHTISDAALWKSLSSVEEFEVLKLSYIQTHFCDGKIINLVSQLLWFFYLII